MAAGDVISGSVDGSRNVAIGKEIHFSATGRDDVPDKDKLDEVWRLVYSISERLGRVETRVAFMLAGAAIFFLAGVLAVLIALF